MKSKEKTFVHRLYGSDGDLAGRAIHAMAREGDLPRNEVAKRLLGYDDSNADRRVMMLAMGRDAARGTLEYDADTDRLVADLDLYHLAPGYAREEQLMKDVATTLGGELRINPAWATLGKPITVHNQGGCPMSDRPADGVTDPDGRVHGCKGLYVNDGALLCRSVGVNPSAAITAIAERNVAEFIKNNPPARPNAEGAAEYARHVAEAERWRARQTGVVLTPERRAERPLQSRPLGLRFTEVMQGYYERSGVDHRGHDAAYRRAETAGRPDFPMRMNLEVSVADLAAFYEDLRHELAVGGKITLRRPGEPKPAEHAVTGRLELMVARDKPYGIQPHQSGRRRAHERLAGTYTTRRGAPPPREQRFLRYYLTLTDAPGWHVFGYKRVRDDGGVEAWRDTSSLFVQLYGPATGAPPGSPSVVQGSGVVHVDLTGFLVDQLPSVEIGYVPQPGSGAAFEAETDPALVSWATARFAAFFFGSLQRVYLPDIQGAVATLFRAAPARPGVRR
jgi:cholesterol oxidase